MRKLLLAVSIVTIVALAGCSSLADDRFDDAGETIPGEQAHLETNASGATDVNHTFTIEVDGTTNGSELSAIGATYPRENFTVDGAKHEAVRVGVDTDGDGELERTFDESYVSGVNNNDYSFDVTLDTDYTLQEGDVVAVTHPHVDNPSEPGSYEIEVRLNDQQNATKSVVIE